ncbi:cob(I)yrinic acid a,c-diamide adenosyltransferase [Magnetospirillum moscoviense]|uniref:Corrinoid adenosyltransferase n=1 Tax=Magnetospirillum moscoviense TaxID=1437059 RepID=A0A178MZE4_9PROT|nr:cob(I)yrinic acid a,c-diamide adenosyltransferase [Magnetospirillum moscoviense]MBF0327269.1 cob(I)yrinic acid a,c-diamide adenosyltransferase [Alphaproteobacteria bacterium]OAN65521.1 cob(I)yrinic acid a,c-diamide adenosyltransferase [Magnetospirillum moscoviense]
MIDDDNLDRHKDKMAKKKASRDKLMAKKQGEKGLVIVHTGPGKGKSTAAFGMALRCVGHGFPVGIVQFIKGAWDTAERRIMDSFAPLVTFKAMGEGFTWETQDRARDVAAAGRAWAMAAEMLADPAIRLVILDEINVALRYDYLALDDVLAAIKARPDGQHVVLTGRNAAPALIEAADLVTEMAMVKHPFRDGIKAQPGIEF